MPSTPPLSVLFATAEAAPLARVGGLAEAAAGLIRALRRRDDVALTVVMPDYGDVELVKEKTRELTLPAWAGECTIRSGVAPELGPVQLISVPDMARPHPYVDATGKGWVDNDRRFFAFSAAVAVLAEELEPDVVHANDWHTGLALAWIERPTVYTIHTLGYQGVADGGWLGLLPPPADTDYEWFGSVNPAAGAIRTAGRVIAVSPNYAAEILDPARGSGLHDVLAARGPGLVGIRNGIDTELWSPVTDAAIAANYSADDLKPKAKCSQALRQELGWPDDDDAVIGMVGRLVEQKGIDIALGLVPYLERMGARMVLLGSGEHSLTVWARELAAAYPDRFAFSSAYDLELAHRIFAGADLFLMPSRFEPCGLAQMQAMAYGTIPVVSAVGGLVDTVVDDDDPATHLDGTGFMALSVDAPGVIDAVHRALRAWRLPSRRSALQRRGMSLDWSWDAPAEAHMAVYRSVVPRAAPVRARSPRSSG